MYRQLIVIALSGLALTCCEPTERTAITKKEDKKQPTEQSVQETSAATTPVVQPADTEPSAPEVTDPAVTAPTGQEPTVTPADTPQPTPADASDAEQPADKTADAAASQLSVALTVQDYNRVMPWEKQSASSTRLNGVYLGDGKVLTLGSSLASANYVEISLPDASRTVPARVLRYDSDLNLGLLVVDNEEDATIFETRSALAVGAAMDKDAKAELWCTLNGTQPAAIALQGEIGTTDRGLPRLQMRTDQAVPGNYSHGAPVVADGKLVGISAGYNSAARQLKVINAELISRFLNTDAAAPKGVPVMAFSSMTS